MQPYGRLKRVKGVGNWKRDYRIIWRGIHQRNWWEDMNNFVSRHTMKQKVYGEMDTHFAYDEDWDLPDIDFGNESLYI